MAKTAAPKPTPFAFCDVVAKAPAAKSSKLAEYFVKETADLAALRSMRDLVDVAIEEVRGRMQTAAMAFYVREGCASKTRPANFRSNEEGHSAMCILGKRRRVDLLTEDEAAVLEQHNLPFAIENSEDTYQFNPAALANPTIRAQIEKALSTVQADGMHLVERVPGTPKRIVTDETVAKVFQLPAEDAEMVLPIVSTFSLRTSWQVISNDLRPMVERVGRFINLPGMAEKLTDLAEKKRKKAA